MDFKGNIALITGAAVGIGRATALRMAELGASVAVVDRDGEKITRVEEDLMPDVCPTSIVHFFEFEKVFAR